ncbi:hypothetical protein NDU88_005833 [Pleurodeles waltl]|uniref:Uncharacterized protein n=1 Tax=Pleurodeles waltl TaxID=8319 RepID=A0AAV7L2H2_PLEWA|nr:hypothetical protein NDU88_005833 [Pleurodeles waltl]
MKTNVNLAPRPEIWPGARAPAGTELEPSGKLRAPDLQAGCREVLSAGRGARGGGPRAQRLPWDFKARGQVSHSLNEWIDE